LYNKISIITAKAIKKEVDVPEAKQLLMNKNKAEDQLRQFLHTKNTSLHQ